jgi:hypothetical protein
MNSSGILYAEAVREFKKVFIANVLEQNKGNQCKAAKQLGMHRNTLSRTMTELDLDIRPLRRSVSNGELQTDRRPPRSAPPASLEKKLTR